MQVTCKQRAARVLLCLIVGFLFIASPFGWFLILSGAVLAVAVGIMWLLEKLAKVAGWNF